MFECKICGRQFNQNYNLNRHLQDVHKSSPHYIQDDDPNLYNFIFYMIKNKVNNMRYVGATTQNSVKKRWKNGKGYSFNKEFTDDIKYYGVDNFELIELERKTCTVYVAKRLEEEYIDKYKPEYNKSRCGIKIMSPKMTLAAQRKLSNIPGWYKNNINSCRKWQKNNPNEVKKIVQKRSIAGAHSKGRPVICIETGIIYPSSNKAAQILGISPSKISECCRGKSKSYKNQHWKFVDEIEENNLNGED